MISLRDVRDALSMTAPHMDELFRTCLGASTADVEFDCFIEFLETGKINFNVAANPQFSRSRAVDFDKLDQPPERRQQRSGGMPPTPPRGLAEPSVQHPEDEPGDEHMPARGGSPHSAMYAAVFSGMGFRRAHSKRHWISSSATAASEDNSGVRALALRFSDGAASAMSGEVRMPPGKPLWRKREVVKSERIVHYTTVDASGLLQELVEKESTETEVLHMECRETGEFAHRETTKYEQQELFNNEVVAEEKGTEEYVHLKSQDDEIEFMESNMPRRGRPQEPPADYEVHEAPEVSADAAVGEGGMWHGDLPRCGAGEGEEPTPYKQDYGDWGASSSSPPHVHVHPPFDDRDPETMLGATFDGIYGTPEPPPPYGGVIPEGTLPDAAAAFGLPPSTHLHVHPHIPADSYISESPLAADRKGGDDSGGQHKQRRKWSPPPSVSHPGTGRDRKVSVAPWYENDSDVEDATDGAEDSVPSGASCVAGEFGGVDKDYLFAPAKSSGLSQADAVYLGACTHADILLQRYDSFKLD